MVAVGNYGSQHFQLVKEAVVNPHEHQSSWIIELASQVTGYQTRVNDTLTEAVAVNHDDHIIEFYPGLSPQCLALAVLVAIARILFNWIPADTVFAH